jgi:hypothetical protein
MNAAQQSGAHILRLPAGPVVNHASIGFASAVPLITRNPL